MILIFHYFKCDEGNLSGFGQLSKMRGSLSSSTQALKHSSIAFSLIFASFLFTSGCGSSSYGTSPGAFPVTGSESARCGDYGIYYNPATTGCCINQFNPSFPSTYNLATQRK